MTLRSKTIRDALTLAEIAKMIGARIVGDSDYRICNVSDLSEATQEDLSFLSNPRYTQMMAQSKAGAVLISDESNALPNRNFLVHEDPTRAFQQVLEYFHTGEDGKTAFTGIHPTAVIHATVKLGSNVSIGPHVVLDHDVVIGDETQIYANSYIGAHTAIGTACVIYPNVTVRERCTIGNRVILQAGVVVGSCGFGYTTDRFGKHQKLIHFGGVIIEDDVEIGANATIDQGRFRPTCIRKGTKIDNLVQIGHHVEVGEDNLIVAQTGIAGSTKTGKHVVLGGQVAVAGHLELESGVMVGGKSGVSKSLKAGKYRGIPAVQVDEFQRNAVQLRNIQRYIDAIAALEKRVQELEKKAPVA